MRRIIVATIALALIGMFPTVSDAAPSWAGKGAFLSYPHQSAPTTINGGTNVVVTGRSWQGFPGRVALVVSGAHNVYLHDLDFADNGGDIFLINCTGTIRVEWIRARNTGDGTIGSGHSNVIQLNNVWQSATDDGINGIRHVKALGGRTEDAISVFKSGGLDATHPLILGDIHLESPLPPSSQAWTSNSGTGINLADAGGHDIWLRNSTILTAGAVGIQMNVPTRVRAYLNIVYGAARSQSNVGLSQWASSACSTCVGNSYDHNRVWWVKANGSPSPLWLSHTAQVADTANVKQDTTINPANLRVVL